MMNFHMDLIQECLRSWVHLKVLESLMQKPQAMSQRQLANVLGMPRVTIQRALRDLGETGLLKASKVGNATFWDLDRNGFLYESLSPALEGLPRITPPLLYLKRLIKDHLTGFDTFRCFIFGSVAAGTDQDSSDIDMAVILRGKAKVVSPKLSKKIEELEDLCRQKFGKRLAVIYLHEDDLKQRQKPLHQKILKGLEIK